MVKCAFDFTGNFETMITPTSIGNDAREDLASFFVLFSSSSASSFRVAENGIGRRLLPPTRSGGCNPKHSPKRDFRGVFGEKCEKGTCASRIVGRVGLCRARFEERRISIARFFLRSKKCSLFLFRQKKFVIPLFFVLKISSFRRPTL